MDAFETTVLTQVYVIEYPFENKTKPEEVSSTIESETTSAAGTTSESTTAETTVSPMVGVSTEGVPQSPTEPDDTTTTSLGQPDVHYVTQAEWNEIRRKHLGEFINMVKLLPDFETIVNSAQEGSVETQPYIELLQKHDSYRTDTLKEAYLLNRQSLEKISSIEQARNHLHSDFKYMALYCLFVAFFLDLSSLFVGLFVHFTDEKGKADIEGNLRSNKDDVNTPN